MRKAHNLIFRLFVIFAVFLLGSLYNPAKVSADTVHYIDPSDTSIAETNLLLIKDLPDSTAEITDHSDNISSSNISASSNIYVSFPKGSKEIKVKIPGNKNNSNISNGIDTKTSITVTYGKNDSAGIGTFSGKKIYAVITYSNFKYNDDWKYSSDSATIEFCQDLYGGVNFSIPLQSMSIKVKFFYKSDDSQVQLNSNSFLTIDSLNYHPATKYSADFQAAEFVTMKDAQYTDAYLTTQGQTSVKAYDNNYSSNGHDIQGYAGTNALAGGGYNGKVFAGAKTGTWSGATDYDYLGSDHFFDGSVTYKLNSVTEIVLRIGMLDYYSDTPNMWFALTSKSLWNAPPVSPTKEVTDTSGNNIDYTETKKKLYLGTKIVYRVSQQVGNLGVDMMTPYKSFDFKDQLPEHIKFLGTGRIVAENESGEKIKTWSFSTKETDNSNVGTLSSTSDSGRTTVNFRFASGFLSNPSGFDKTSNTNMVYDHRKYILEIDCQVTLDTPANTDVVNMASVNIDKYGNDTNKVTVQIIKNIPQTGSNHLLMIFLLLLIVSGGMIYSYHYLKIRN